MNKLLTLTPEDCENNKPTKILNSDLTIKKAYSSGVRYYFDTIEEENFHESLKRVFELESSFIVLGGLTEFGEVCQSAQKPFYRRKKSRDGIEPTIRDRRSNEIVLDVDEIVIPGYNPLEPLPGIKNFLNEHNINCDVTWQITSGQQLDTDSARIRLYFECSEKKELLTRKAWSQSIGCDGSVYTCSQPIYTAPPIINNAEDPITQRTGFIKGEHTDFQLPKLTREEHKRYSQDFMSLHNYDFTQRDLPPDVKAGKIYRRYFMPYAFSLANKGLSREEIFLIIAGKSQPITARPFDEDNVFQYIDHALERIEEEQANVLMTEEEKDEFSAGDLPQFPHGIMDKWPEPWPMIFRNFEDNVRGKYVEQILFFTVMACCSHSLKSKYINGFGKIPNTFSLVLYPSGGGKDTNMRDAIRNISTAFNSRVKKEGKLEQINSDLFSVITTDSHDNITSDTAFLGSFDEADQTLFMLDTEATKTIQKINSVTNENVAGLGAKMIEVANGYEIKGKQKAGGKEKSAKGFMDPTCQIMLAGQPETTAEALTEDNISSGLLARCNITYVPPEEHIDVDEFLGLTDKESRGDIDDEFYEFFSSGKLNELSIKSQQTKMKIDFSDKQKEEILNWKKDFIVGIAKDNPELKPLLLRAVYVVEQYFTIIYGVCNQWDLFHDIAKEDFRLPADFMSLDSLFELAEYILLMKIYLLRNVISRGLDVYASAIVEIIGFLSANPEKAHKSYRLKCKTGYIPLSAIKYRLTSTRYSYLKKERDSSVEKLSRTLKTLVEHGDLVIKDDEKGKPVYGISRRNGD